MMSMNAVAVTTTSTLIRRSAPAARGAGCGSRRRSSRATLTLGTSGCIASARTAISVEPLSAASIVVRSTSLIAATSACACGGVGPIATGTGPLRPTIAGTSTTACSSRNGSAERLAVLRIMIARVLLAIASTSASASPS